MEPTKTAKHTKTLLDQIPMKPQEKVIPSSVIEMWLSSHELILIITALEKCNLTK